MTLCNERMDSKTLENLAAQVLRGNYFLRTIDSPDIQVAWQTMFAFMDELYFTEENWKNVGAVYAPMTKVFDLEVNGLPQFYAISFVHRDDVPRLLRTIDYFDKVLSGGSHDN
jgi:hypothetical protein